MEKIKRLVFLLAMVIAIVMSSCSSEKHQKYIPADSKLLGKIDVKAFFKQSDADYEKLMKDIEEYLGDDASSIKDCGIDVKAPIYIFGHGDKKYSLGIVAKVGDKEKVKNWLEEKEKKIGIKLKGGDDFDYGVHNVAAIGLNDDALVLLWVINGNEDDARKEIKKIMGKEDDGDLNDNKLMDRVKDSKAFACLYADMSIIPEDIVKTVEKEAPQIKEQLSDLRTMTLGIDGTFNDGICDFEIWAESGDDKVQKKIDAAKSIYKTPSDKAVNSLPEGSLAGIATNVDGGKLADYLESNVKDTKLIDECGEEQQIIFETLLRVLDGINGDLAGYLVVPGDVLVAVKSKSDISTDVAELLVRVTASTESSDCIDDDTLAELDTAAVSEDSDVDYSSGFGRFSPYIKETSNGYYLTEQGLWLGYNNGAIYFTNNERLTSSAFKNDDTSLPSNLSSFIKDHRFVMFLNVGKLSSYTPILPKNDKKVINAFSEVIKKIKYVTLSMK